MGFLSNVLSATVKATILPVAVAKDVILVATDKEPSTTKKLAESMGKDLSRAADTMMGENNDSLI